MTYCKEPNVVTATEIAKQSMEKQKPKKIFSAYSDERGIIFGDCPTCSFAQNSLWNSKYCGNCGQKLDWSE